MGFSNLCLRLFASELLEKWGACVQVATLWWFFFFFWREDGDEWMMIEQLQRDHWKCVFKNQMYTRLCMWEEIQAWKWLEYHRKQTRLCLINSSVSRLRHSLNPNSVTQPNQPYSYQLCRGILRLLSSASWNLMVLTRTVKERGIFEIF